MASKKEVVAELLIEKSAEEKVEVSKANVILEHENKLFKDKLFIVEQQLENSKQEIKTLKKTNEEIIANEHTVRQELNRIKIQFNEYEIKIQNKEKEMLNLGQAKEKEIAALKNDLTKLATLFDEYIVSFQDQVKLLGVFVRNTQTVEKYLSGKIDEYNGGNKK